MRYLVVFSLHGGPEIEVEAADGDEAIAKATDLYKAMPADRVLAAAKCEVTTKLVAVKRYPQQGKRR